MVILLAFLFVEGTVGNYHSWGETNLFLYPSVRYLNHHPYKFLRLMETMGPELQAEAPPLDTTLYAGFPLMFRGNKGWDGSVGRERQSRTAGQLRQDSDVHSSTWH